MTRAQVRQAPRDLQVVAHEDDDVIFMNPDIRNAIKAGHIVRTVFVTAGNVCPNGQGTCDALTYDALFGGTDTQYWQSRERGALAAYATMAGKLAQGKVTGAEGYSFFHTLYGFSTITVPGSCGGKCKVDVWTLRGTKTAGQVSLVFLRVSSAAGPSNMFPLEKLWQGSLSSLMTVGSIGTGYAATTDDTLTCDPTSPTNPAGCRTYTQTQLTALVTGIMKEFKPTRVRLQDPTGGGYDNTDHTHAARIGLNAYWSYLAGHPAVVPGLRFYRGYITYPPAAVAGPFPVNVTGAQMAAKQAALNAYCVFDTATGGAPGCYSGDWGPREYSLSALTFRAGPVLSALHDTGQPGCLTPSASGSAVTVTACGDAAPSWSMDARDRLTTGSRCLNAARTVGTAGKVTVAPCSGSSSHWVYLSNGMLISDNSKVLRAASDGSVNSVDPFSYNAVLTAGGVGNLPVGDITDLGYRWVPGAVPVGG